MKLFNYLDIQYRNLNIELQQEYTISKEAELKAAYSIIQMQRSFFKWLHIPLLVSKYVLIRCRVLQAPELITVKKAPLQVVPQEANPKEASPSSTTSH